MICLISSSRKNAQSWAAGQNLRDDEWFWPSGAFDIIKRKNFHTILVSQGLEHVTNDWINTMLEYAWKYGRAK